MVLLLAAFRAAGAPAKNNLTRITLRMWAIRRINSFTLHPYCLYNLFHSLRVSDALCMQLAGNTVESSVSQNVLLFEVNYTHDQIIEEVLLSSE